MSLSVEEVIARVPQWAGATDLKTSFLAGGITNQNYRVEVGGETFVLRISGENTELLGINRDHEHAAHRAAAEQGIAPEVLFFIQPEGYLVTRFVFGRPMLPEEMGRPHNIQRLVTALQQIHGLPPIPATFSPFRTVEDYAETARGYGVRFPDNFDWLIGRMGDIEAALRRAQDTAFAKGPFTPRLCHNDLLNENFLDDGRVRILDWEYAGMGDVFFDLANFAVHHGFSDEQDRFLLECYFGEATPARLAQLRLMKIMSDFREAMWGMVQIGISALDFDFRGYADKHFARMTESLNSPRSGRWLTEVVQGV